MKLYILLILSHIIGDIFLQRNIVIRKIFKDKELWQLKRQNVKYLTFHAMLYSLPVSITFIYLHVFTVYRLLIIFISHFIIDYVKCYMVAYKYMSFEFFIINLIDQVLHISILFIVLI